MLSARTCFHHAEVLLVCCILTLDMECSFLHVCMHRKLCTWQCDLWVVQGQRTG